MLSIKIIRENSDLIKDSEKRRGHDPKIVDLILDQDKKWKKELQKVEQLKHKRNVISEEINKAKKAKKESLAQKKISLMKKAIKELKSQEDIVNKLFQERQDSIKKVGNILQDKVPSGKDENDNVVIKTVGKKPSFKFPIKDHIELGLDLDIIDLDTAAKNSGARFYYLKNEAVLLSFALQRYAMDKLMADGFDLIKTPFMLNRAALEGGVNLSEFEDTIYKIQDEDLYLIATSEHPLIALKRNEVIPEADLPLKIVGVSSCFRKELGTHGRDDKGIFRVHEFNKVEEIVYCKPEDSKKYFNKLQKISEEIFKELKLPFRVMNICTGDIGNKQSLQYDIEAWFPAQDDKKGRYREVTSCSNCTNYQSTTLNTKYLSKDGKTKDFVHLLNNTALTDTRPIAAILENFQTAKGTVKIPKVLWPYMNGVTEIKIKKN